MSKKWTTTFDRVIDRVKKATGEKKSDLVFKNAKYVNLFTDEIVEADIALVQRRIVVNMAQIST